MVTMLVHLRGRAMRTVALVHLLERHGAGLQRNIEPHEKESRDAGSGTAGATIANFGQDPQITRFRLFQIKVIFARFLGNRAIAISTYPAPLALESGR